MLQQGQPGQQGQLPPSLPTDPEAAAKFLQAMQSVMDPAIAGQTLNKNKNPNSNEDDNDNDDEQSENELDPDSFVIVKEEAEES